MPFLDRDSFIALLDRLGDADDGKVLSAAREIHQRMSAADLKWGDLLLPTAGSASAESAGAEGGDGEGTLDQPAQAAGDDYVLIDRLLARSTLSPDTREELAGLRADIDSGAFTARDRKYLQSLEARLKREG
jgi:hypothetical protein